MISSFYFAIKAIPVQAWTSSEGSRMLGSQIYRKSAQEGGKVFSSTFLYQTSITIHVEVDPIFRMLNTRKNEICC